MAIPKFDDDVEIISKLGDYPGTDNGLSAADFKAKFDAAPKLIKSFINDKLIPALNTLVDVQALLNNVLDSTLTNADKAANAKVVGDLFKQVVSDAKFSQATMFAKLVQGGDYVIEQDRNFETQLVSVNKIRVYGGALVIQGNLLEVNTGSYVDLDIESGLVGAYRHDLICARFTRDAEDKENCYITILKGTQSTDGGVDPEYVTGDINAGGSVVHEVPLRRLVFNGASVSIEEIRSVQLDNREYMDSKHFTASATIGTNWKGDSAPYTQIVAVPGVQAKDRPHIFPVYADDLETALIQRTAWAMVSDADAEVDAITFVCFEDLPAVSIPIQIEVNR